MGGVKKNPAVARQLARLHRQERKTLEKTAGPIGRQLADAGRRVEEKLPEKAVAALRAAFEKGFRVVFEKGTGVIEKVSGPEKRRGDFECDQFALRRRPTAANLRRFDSRAGRARLANQALSAAEGGLLGVLGIGLPDIPVFLGVILKSVYETALSYGYAYADGAERVFVLAVVCAGVSKGEARRAFSADCDRIGYAIDRGAPCPEDLDEWISRAAGVLADRMVVAKSVQGLPVVGAVGGVANSLLIGQVGRMAALKYKKRFLYALEDQR